MPTYRVNGMWVHMKFANKRSAPKPCRAVLQLNGRYEHCCAMSTLLCDWPVDGGTCDMPLCPDHGTEVGRDRHYCPKHLAQHKANNPELFPMTHEELMALPDHTETFGQRETVVDGRKVVVPVAPHAHAMLKREGDGLFTDRDGIEWMVGWIDGVRVRRRVTGHFTYSPESWSESMRGERS